MFLSDKMLMIKCLFCPNYNRSSPSFFPLIDSMKSNKIFFSLKTKESITVCVFKCNAVYWCNRLTNCITRFCFPKTHSNRHKLTSAYNPLKILLERWQTFLKYGYGARLLRSGSCFRPAVAKEGWSLVF